MLKRVNKITALLVAATTVMSAIPVMASEKNLIPRLGELDGGITNAVAYKDGKYIFEGSKPDEDYGVYYNDGTKDTKLDDVDSLNDIKNRGLSSIVIPNGSKEEIFNLNDGKVDVDGDTDDAATTARAKLENKLSKTNKYGSNVKVKEEDFKEVPSNRFGDDNTWYQYKAEGNKSYYSDINNEDATVKPEIKSAIKVVCNGQYADVTIAGVTFTPNWIPDMPLSLETQIKGADFGKYSLISVEHVSTPQKDGSIAGPVTAILGSTDELTSVPDKFTEFNDPKNPWGSYASMLSQDDLNKLKEESKAKEEADKANKKVIYYGYADANGNYIDCSKIANIRLFNGESVVEVENFNDKKVSNDKKVKVGLPTIIKTLAQDPNYIYNLIEVPVTGYQALNAAKSKSDAVTSLCYVQKISKVQGNNKDGGAYVPKDVDSYFLANDTGFDGDNWGYKAAYTDIHDGTENMKVQADGNQLYVVDTIAGDDGIEVRNAKIKLRKGSVITKENDDVLGNRPTVKQPIVFVDMGNGTEFGDKSDTDINVNKTDSGSWDVDYEGNAWSIYNGRIKMSGQGYDFEDKYRCSGNMNRISVYDENNLIAWEDGGDTYVTVKDGQVTQHEVTKTGWKKAEDGSWHLYDLKGNDSKGWVNVKSCWYYFDDKGAMKTGWADIDGKSYYLGTSGVRSTGWTKVDGEYYYFDEAGVKQVSTTINGYKLNSKGVRVN